MPSPDLAAPDPDASAAALAEARARFACQPGKQAEVSKSLWNAWYGAKQEVETWAGLVRKYEIELREQAGEASELCVNGELVACRVISVVQVKTHVRHQDYIKRIK